MSMVTKTENKVEFYSEPKSKKLFRHLSLPEIDTTVKENIRKGKLDKRLKVLIEQWKIIDNEVEEEHIVISYDIRNQSEIVFKIAFKNPIYFGCRDENFTNLVKGILEKGKLKPKYIDMLMSEDGLKTYDQVFTSKTANPDVNYEVFENLGDLTANKCIGWYMFRRFPQLNCTDGVKVLARLKINYGAKGSFFDIADKLGFWNYITSSDGERNESRKDLLEDTLEAFVGATEYLIDMKTRNGVGYAICYDIIENIFNDMDISLAYQDLFDSKTKLKELFDAFDRQRKRPDIEIVKDKKYLQLDNKNLIYRTERNEETRISTTRIYYLSGGKEKLIGIGSAAAKKNSQQNASSNALKKLWSMGYEKPEKVDYKRFCNFNIKEE